MSVRLLERKDDPLGIGIGVSNGACLTTTQSIKRMVLLMAVRLSLSVVKCI